MTFIMKGLLLYSMLMNSFLFYITKTLTRLIPLFCSCLVISQTAFYNAGNVTIHEQGTVGFHLDIINDGNFDENKGLVGIYSSGTLQVSGSKKPVFYNLDQAASKLILNVPVGVYNTNNFMLGNIVTPKNNSSISFDFIDDAYYVGASNSAHVNGYASVNGVSTYTFPVGDGSFLRPLIIENADFETTYKSAYFRENPNTTNVFNFSITTSEKHPELDNISTTEFWVLEGTQETNITLTWDPNSAIASLTDDLDDLIVAGWSIIDNQWISLGNTFVAGSLENGSISSIEIIPDDYAAFTFASQSSLYLDADTGEGLSNYFISPNGDGLNDFLELPGIEDIGANTLSIFNRWGKLVFKKENYDNSFNGIANVSMVVNKDSQLPIGTYFYILEMHDLGSQHQGYIYISR